MNTQLTQEMPLDDKQWDAISIVKRCQVRFEEFKSLNEKNTRCLRYYAYLAGVWQVQYYLLTEEEFQDWKTKSAREIRDLLRQASGSAFPISVDKNPKWFDVSFPEQAPADPLQLMYDVSPI